MQAAKKKKRNNLKYSFGQRAAIRMQSVVCIHTQHSLPVSVRERVFVEYATAFCASIHKRCVKYCLQSIFDMKLQS